MTKHYRFTMVYNGPDEAVDYLTVDGEALEYVPEEIEEDPDEFFNELVGDRFEGMEFDSYEEVDEIPKGERPFTIN